MRLFRDCLATYPPDPLPLLREGGSLGKRGALPLSKISSPSCKEYISILGRVKERLCPSYVINPALLQRKVKERQSLLKLNLSLFPAKESLREAKPPLYN